MARRIEIELTSARPDGTWTWRAAGALNPRGSLDSSLLYDGAKAGDVVRAEAEFGMEGITVVSVEPPAPPEADDPNRIKLVERQVTGGVTAQLAGRARSGPGRGRSDRGGPDRGGPERSGRANDTEHEGERAGGPRQARPQRGADRTRPAGRRPASLNGSGALHGPAEAGPEGRGDLPPQDGTDKAPDGGPEVSGQRRASASADRGRPQQGRPARGRGQRAPGSSATGPSAGAAPRRRLNVASTHRNALLESLPVEQRPIAQQLMRGGVPAVRTALHFEREKAREEGRPEPSTEGVLAIAESLVSRVKAAEWRDRAEAAIKAGDDLPTRDLRLLVNGSDVARDEQSRPLATTLREMLESRVEANREAWATEVAKHLDEGQTLRALRLSGHPPDASARFSAELATRLRDAAGTALAPSTSPDKWLAVLQAAAESPVRRAVKPVGLPEAATPFLLDAARQQCGRLPGLAPLLGLPVPPPPGPARSQPARSQAQGRTKTLTRHGARRPGAADRKAPRPSEVVETGGGPADELPAAAVETAEPVVETAEPVVETAEPMVETAEPMAETAEPVAERPEPVAEDAGVAGPNGSTAGADLPDADASLTVEP